MHSKPQFMINAYHSTDEQKACAENWFRDLQKRICSEFERIENEYAGPDVADTPPGTFTFTPWERAHGGGGIIGKMRGRVFEKVGVNISTVFGEFSPEFRKEIPGADQGATFWAAGISLVAHMHSPFVPTVHMNTRHIVTQKSWFGGGSDLTPSLIFEKDTQDFHQAFKKACDQHDPTYYPRFKKWCEEYFYLPHRKEMRGVGGIFYDYVNSGSWEDDFAFTKDIGLAFLEIYPKLVRRRMYTPWTKDDKRIQLEKRGRYVEFNLLHDRGTRFGLMTDGNIDAILMSMPPCANWA